jgi:signal transduction histidine kinase
MGLNLSEITTLVGEAPIPVVLDCSGEPRLVPAEIGRSAYRVVRDALDAATNASAASVAIEYVPGALVVQVEDDGGGRCARDFDELRELAAALGGGLRAAPEGRGFRVRAWLPTEGQPPSGAAPRAPR